MDKPKPIDIVHEKTKSLLDKADNTLNKLDSILDDLKEIKECLKRIDNNKPEEIKKGWIFN